MGGGLGSEPESEDAQYMGMDEFRIHDFSYKVY